MPDGKGYKLPETIDPEALQCFKVYVPDDTLYLAAFWSAYRFFGTWLAWERDDAHSGAAAAAVWRNAFELARAAYEAGEGCEMFDVRSKPDEPCILQKTIDGETWVDFADLRDCPPNVMLGSDGKTLVYWCPTCGPDGGPGWTPLPNPDTGYDPANDDPQTPVTDWVAPGNDPTCVFGANVSEAFRSVMERVGYGLLIGAITTTIWTDVIVNLFTAKVLPKKARSILDLLTSASQYTSDDFNNDLETFDWQELTNILCCFFGDDGTVTDADFADGQAAMASKSGPVWDLIKGLVAIVGTNGMNNAATYAGIIEADCDCDCDPDLSECWDFRIDDHDFVAVAGKGVWVPLPGSGWTGQLQPGGASYELDISGSVGIPAGTIDSVRIDFSFTGGSKHMWVYVDGNLKGEVVGGSAGYRSVTFPVNEAISTLRIRMSQSTLNSALNCIKVCYFRS